MRTGPVSCRNQSSGCLRFTARLLASLRPAPLLLFPATEGAQERGASQRDFNCRWDRGHFSGRGVGTACYGNERKERRHLPESGAWPFPRTSTRWFTMQSRPEQVVSTPQAGSRWSAWKMCAAASGTLPDSHYLHFFGGGSVTASCPKNDPF